MKSLELVPASFRITKDRFTYGNLTPTYPTVLLNITHRYQPSAQHSNPVRTQSHGFERKRKCPNFVEYIRFLAVFFYSGIINIIHSRAFENSRSLMRLILICTNPFVYNRLPVLQY